jgi:PPK2 family polyphosphate:nucleotide phosphotransferase
VPALLFDKTIIQNQTGDFHLVNPKHFIALPNKRFRFADHDPDFTAEFKNEEESTEIANETAENLARLQDIFLAHENHAVLMLFQAMDSAGKDDTIKHVLSSVDPQGCKATTFDEPSKKDLKHVYLWRYVQALPEAGQIGIFNRSYYEQVTAERIHPDKLTEWKLSTAAEGGDKLWVRRYQEINNFESYLAANGITLLKCFLHISKRKQAERLLERTELTEKKWKFSLTDLEDRRLWARYSKVYEEVINRTSTKSAPWYIIPANHRWFTRAAISSLILETLKGLHARYPVPDKEQKRNLSKAQTLLKKELRPARHPRAR